MPGFRDRAGFGRHAGILRDQAGWRDHPHTMMTPGLYAPGWAQP